jgi:hypothetical protein
MNLTKPRLDQFKITGSTVGDVYFPQTELLLPFNGTNGATTTSDLSDNNHAVTFVGTSQISTAQSKFGGSSMLFDGDSDYVSVTSSTLGSFAASTFTIEFWVYHISLPSDLIYYAINWAGASNGVYLQKNSDHTIGARLLSNTGAITGTTVMTTGQWYHVALSGSDGSYKLFLDGALEGTHTGSSSTGSNTWHLGAWLYSGNNSLYYPLNGYLDDIRFTSAARYTSAFTPPTTAHLTSAGDVNKQIIVNSTADGVAIGTGGINQARIAKAWVNFNGTGTVAINGSYNVSSITDDGTGDYDINFSTALSDTNYVVVGTVGGSGIVGFKRDQNETRTTNKAGVYSLNGSHALADGPYIEAIVFGN